MRGRSVLAGSVVAACAAVLAWPGPAAVATSCAGPTLEVSDSVPVGETAHVTGTFGDCPGQRGASCARPDQPEPGDTRDVTLRLTQGTRQWELGTATAVYERVEWVVA